MATEDLIQLAGLTGTWVKISGDKTLDYGVLSDLWDGTSDEYGVGRYSDDPDITYRLEIRFTEGASSVKALTNFYMKYNTYGTYDVGYTTVDVVFADDSTEEIYHDDHTYAGDGEQEVSVDGEWGLVKGLDITMRRAYYRSSSTIKLVVKEMTLTGYNWADSGLRVFDGVEVLKIPVNSTGESSGVQVYDGTSVFGVDMLDESSALASPIRVYDGSAVKALPTIGYDVQVKNLGKQINIKGL